MSRKKVQPVKEEVEEAVEVKEDRSAFNCVPCQGEGLIGPAEVEDRKVCPQCLGRGKSN